MTAAETVLVLLVVAGLGYGGYYLYERSTVAPGDIKCVGPTDPKFAAVLSNVASGKTDAATAETIAKGYENGGCPDMASAVRAAVPVKVSAPPAETPGPAKSSPTPPPAGPGPSSPSAPPVVTPYGAPIQLAKTSGRELLYAPPSRRAA